MRLAEKNGRTPLNMRIYSEIRSEIESGTYQKGDFLPTESELTEHYSVSRKTVRTALKHLSDDGLAEPVHGQGWQVCVEVSDRSALPVAVITPSGGIPARYDPCVSAFRECLEKHGLSVRLYGLPGSHFEAGDSLKGALDPESVQGLFIISGLSLPESIVNEAREKRLPLVCAGLDAAAPFDTVCTDNRTAGSETIELLYKKGHRKILLVNTTEVDEASFRARHESCKSYIDEKGLGTDEIFLELNWIGPGEFEQILNRVRENNITAVICVNEFLGWNMILHCSRTGIRIPDELSVIAMGDMDREPELLTLGLNNFVYAQHPWNEIGRLCGEKMAARLEGDSSPAEYIQVEPVLKDIDTVIKL